LQLCPMIFKNVTRRHFHISLMLWRVYIPHSLFSHWQG